MLEVNFGLDQFRFDVPLTEVEPGKFLLKTHSSHFHLQYILKEWCLYNPRMKSKEYEALVSGRASLAEQELQTSLCTFNIEILRNLEKI